MGYCSIVVFLSLITIIGGVAQGYGNDYSYMNEIEDDIVYCYQCTSIKDSDCRDIDPLNEDTKYKFNMPCMDTEKYNGSKPFCRKITQIIFARENMDIVIRKCGWVKHPRLDCYSVRNEDHIETSCQCFEPACNNAPALLRSSTLLSLVLLLAYSRL